MSKADIDRLGRAAFAEYWYGNSPKGEYASVEAAGLDCLPLYDNPLTPWYAEHWRKIISASLLTLQEPDAWRIDTPEGQAIMARRKAAYVSACQTSGGCERGSESQDQCAYCADIADNVIQTFIASLLAE